MSSWVHAKLLQSCVTLCDRIDYSPLGSSVHGILQARIPEWIAMSFSRGSSQLRNRTHISCFLQWQADSLSLVPPGKPKPQGMPGSPPSGVASHPSRGESTPVWLRTSPQAQPASARTSRGRLLTWAQNKPNRCQGQPFKHRLSLKGKFYPNMKVWEHFQTQQPRMVASLLLFFLDQGQLALATLSRCLPWLPGPATS